MEGEGPRFRAKDLVILLLAAACTALELVVHLGMGIAVVYTQLFYLVIILAAYWYREKAVILAVYLGILHVGVGIAVTGAVDMAAVARAILFVVVALVAAFLVRRLEGDSRTASEYLASRARRLREPLTALARNLHGLRTDLEGIAAVRRMRSEGDVAGLVATLGHRDPDLR
ncbi:MAG: hypothetical protein LUO91_01380, partial [Methanomicrobiales archaeon]|nr:hypothetical protein [Methanomicrobiales archaeon]